MKRWRIQCFHAGFPAFMVLFLLFYGCGGDSGDSPGAVEPGSSLISQAGEDSDTQMDSFLTDAGIFRDEGDPCREHHYRVSAGSMVILGFEQPLLHPARAEEALAQITHDEWQVLGIDAWVVETEIITQTVTRTLWGVDFSEDEFIRDDRGEPHFYLRDKAAGARGITGLKWVRDWTYVVSEINGRRWPERVLMNLTEADLSRICDGEAVFRIQEPLGEAEMVFPLQPVGIETELSFARIQVQVVLARDITAEVSRKQLLVESPNAGRFVLRLSANPRTSRLITVSGPAFHQDCW